MAFPPPLGTPPAFKDRKTGLTVFGILTILLGGLCVLFALFFLFTFSRLPQTGGPFSPAMLMGMIVLEYGGLATILIWLGIGSIMARRWARALILIFSWTWLILGVYVCVMMAVLLPHIMETAQPAVAAKVEVSPAATGTVDATTAPQPPAPALPAVATTVITVISFAFTFGTFVVLPGIWVLFYRSKDVQATCEAYDPVVRWTDRRPLPVTAMCLWLGASVPMTLLATTMYKGVVPVFGSFVTGPLGSVLYVALALNWSYCVWALAKMQMRGWWWTLGTFVVTGISVILTYLRHDVSEMYTLMGFPAEQIAQIQKLKLFQGQMAIWLTLCGFIPFLGFLLYLRKYFVRPPESVVN